jgi:NADH:ubiquinone oxidoreductase subunit 6 (subunit J)
MNRQQYLAGMSVLVLAMLIIGSLLMAVWPAGEPTNIGLDDLGIGTFETFGVTFLIVGLVMFTSMLGGVFLAKEEDDE